MVYILDASAFLNNEGMTLKGNLVTTAEIRREIKDFKSRALFSSFSINILAPKQEFVDMVKIAAKRTGDDDVLSKADVSVLALALQERGTLVTDDYDIQNMCHEIGLKFIPASMKKIKKRFFRKKFCYKCREFREGTGRNGDVCGVCGAKLKTKVVKTEDIHNSG